MPEEKRLTVGTRCECESHESTPLALGRVMAVQFKGVVGLVVVRSSSEGYLAMLIQRPIATHPGHDEVST